MSGKVSHGGRGFSLEQLQHYGCWAGQSPRRVWEAVVEHGGWAKVFPQGRPFPIWASRVRNYFNETPVYLTPVPTEESFKLVRQIREKAPYGGISIDGGKTAMALVEAVYVDTRQYHWFLMNWSSTPYHTGDGTAGKYKKGKTIVLGQRNTVFKLISPDYTGGSLELIVKNPNGSSKLGGKPGEAFVVDADFDPITQGSYNYAETVISGASEHERMDVEPHVAKNPRFYVNPPPHSKMSDRKIPARLPAY